MEWLWWILFAALCASIGVLFAVCTRVASRPEGQRP